MLILGSYEDSALQKLEELRNFLIGKEYYQTCLVFDFQVPEKDESESPADYALRKSEYWLSRADVPVFIFLPEVDNTGVGYEFQHVVNNHPDMMWRSIVAISKKPRANISRLLTGVVHRWSQQLNQVHFGNQKELCEEVRGTLTSLLGPLFRIVEKRGLEEWEMTRFTNSTTT